VTNSTAKPSSRKICNHQTKVYNPNINGLQRQMIHNATRTTPMPPFIGPCYRHFYQGQGVTLMPQRPQIKLIISPGMQSWCIHHIYPGAANTNCVPTGDNMQHHISSNGGGDNYIASCNGGILAQSPVTQLPSGQPIVGDLLQWYITFHSIRLDNQTLHSEVHQLQLSKHIQDLQGS
jgi:hypothetical protein